MQINCIKEAVCFHDSAIWNQKPCLSEKKKNNTDFYELNSYYKCIYMNEFVARFIYIKELNLIEHFNLLLIKKNYIKLPNYNEIFDYNIEYCDPYRWYFHPTRYICTFTMVM